MKRRARAVGAVALFLGLALPLAAPATEAPPPPPAAPGPEVVPAPAVERGTGHKGQFGIRAHTGSGFYYVVGYAGTTLLCGVSASQCSGRVPWYLRFDLTYGVTDSMEIDLGVRVGLEHSVLDEAGTHEVILHPGVLLCLAEGKRAKLLLPISVVLDVTGDFNVGAAGGLGFQYDFLRNLGAFLQAEAGLMFLGMARFEALLSIGLQGRFP